MVMKTEVIEKNQTDGSATKAAAPMSSINKSSSLSSNKKMRKFKGVRMRSWGSWVSEIRAPNQKTRIWLGSYSTAEAAARAYDAALICLKGPSANLNFPTFSQQNFPLKTNDNLHHHHMITNMSPKNIQKIAAQAANTLLDNAISSSSTASVASSPSPSNTIEDHNNSLPSQFEEYLKPNETAVLNVMDHSVPWFNNFGSFKFREMIDDMLSFDDQQPPFKMIDNHVYEGEEDLRLWDFC